MKRKTIGFEKEIVFSAQYFQAIRYKKIPTTIGCRDYYSFA
ncbi:hypothetical protein HMPREF9296_2567 [Prevotella disiens FB035-09AN]|uniref:Uncharacterized protein n=1 Tax=Prevotella disiens FB035-09AN TaxID=866771 RepID=E1KP31_9BACT|nr:hypothetical protein HMPREF9296_2567 [Prevotella disiens FB035-09AN]